MCPTRFFNDNAINKGENMLKKIAATLLVASGVMCAAGTAQAQYIGPSQAVTYKNVAEILKNPVDDIRVTLRGKIVNRLSDDMYQFTDGTGTIKVEIDEEDFAGQRVDANTQVEIWGKVDKDLMRAPEVDVKRLTVIR